MVLSQLPPGGAGLVQLERSASAAQRRVDERSAALRREPRARPCAKEHASKKHASVEHASKEHASKKMGRLLNDFVESKAAEAAEAAEAVGAAEAAEAAGAAASGAAASAGAAGEEVEEVEEGLASGQENGWASAEDAPAWEGELCIDEAAQRLRRSMRTPAATAPTAPTAAPTSTTAPAVPATPTASAPSAAALAPAAPPAQPSGRGHALVKNRVAQLTHDLYVTIDLQHEANNERHIEALLVAGADPSRPDPSSRPPDASPIFLAAATLQLGTVRRLLAYWPSGRPMPRSKRNETPLLACRHGQKWPGPCHMRRHP